MSQDSALSRLSAMALPDSSSIAKSVADKEYNQLMRYWNVTSYSMLEVLKRCPRLFQLSKAQAVANPLKPPNVDFVFGHAVGAGVATWVATRDMDEALLQCMLAWKAPFELRLEKKRKSLWEACDAVMMFPDFWDLQMSDWQVWTLPNGKPAVETAVEIDFENGFKHYLHIDLILQNRHSGSLGIGECKTHGFAAAEPAIYANSEQGVGYGAALDMLADVTEYDVFYMCFSSPSAEWELLPFPKSVSQKAEYLAGVQLDHAAISTFREVGLYPKHGQSCFAFNRRCQFFGECNLTTGLPEAMTLAPEEHAEPTDFQFTLSQMKEKQQAKIAAGSSPEEFFTGGGMSFID